MKLISYTIYHNFESATFGEIIKENFIINLKEIEQFRSTSLESAENKPSITILKWAKGSVFDTEYLKKGVLFTEKTQNKIFMKKIPCFILARKNSKSIKKKKI